MSDKTNSKSGGMLTTNSDATANWDGATVLAADMYSNWVKTSDSQGYVSFHYNISNTDLVGTLRVQASNDPDLTNLSAVNVELSDGTTGVAITTGDDASGFIQVTRNKALYYRMFIDYTSGTADGGNTITAVVHQ